MRLILIILLFVSKAQAFANNQSTSEDSTITLKKISEDQNSEYHQDRSWSLGAGFAAVDESDDRYRPALHLNFIWNDWFSNFYYLSRRAKSFHDQTFINSFGYSFHAGQIPFTPIDFNALAGVGWSLTRQSLHAGGVSESDSSFNISGVLGLSVSHQWNNTMIQAGWESHLYPTGLATIFFVLARRQALYLNLGYQF